jgi:ATP-dependent HslUV protease ATP-binding subunit HslU
MVRDLVETSVRLVKEDRMLAVKERAEQNANARLVELLVPSAKKAANYKNPLEMLFGGGNTAAEQDSPQEDYSIAEKRKIVKEKLALGKLEDEIVTVEVEEQTPSMFDMLQGSGIEQMGMNMQDALSSFMPKKRKKRKLTVREARKVLTNEEAAKLIDMDEVTSEALYRTEQTGIIFIDEIDAIGRARGKSNFSGSNDDIQGYFLVSLTVPNIKTVIRVVCRTRYGVSSQLQFCRANFTRFSVIPLFRFRNWKMAINLSLLRKCPLLLSYYPHPTGLLVH